MPYKERLKSKIGGLVRNCKEGQVITMNNDSIIIEVVQCFGNSVRLAIRAPQEVDIGSGDAINFVKPK